LFLFHFLMPLLTPLPSSIRCYCFRSSLLDSCPPPPLVLLSAKWGGKLEVLGASKNREVSSFLLFCFYFIFNASTDTSSARRYCFRSSLLDSCPPPPLVLLSAKSGGKLEVLGASKNREVSLFLLFCFYFIF